MLRSSYVAIRAAGPAPILPDHYRPSEPRRKPVVRSTPCGRECGYLTRLDLAKLAKMVIAIQFC